MIDGITYIDIVGAYLVMMCIVVSSVISYSIGYREGLRSRASQ